MDEGGVPPVVHAAAIAYGFVFLHSFAGIDNSFEDGNGRIHRFLIHNILARRGFRPEGIMFPVSASMLKNRTDYDASLEAFSCPLMPLIDYSLDEQSRRKWSSGHSDCSVPVGSHDRGHLLRLTIAEIRLARFGQSLTGFGTNARNVARLLHQLDQQL